jgi:hypothetical protein
MSDNNSIVTLLNKVPSSDKYINLPYSSSTNISKDNFSNSIKHIQGLLKSRYDNSSLRVYQYRDLNLSVDHTNQKTYTSENHIETLYNDIMCIFVKEVKIVPKECFPIVDKYSSVTDQKIKTLSGGKDIKVHFIEQLGTNVKDDSRMSIRVDFVNRDQEVRSMCEKVIKKLSLC